ncbi:MAG: hypothetical protein BMS9Abin37_2082 [Acidobacteriota bacterium]|nr:MAG: hypothetical protein BMS9Abin37_2082 [Acidobacteriota bacterium]
MTVRVTTHPDFQASTPTRLFSESDASVDLSGGGGYIAFFDVSPDGNRFLVLQTHDESTPQINLVLNWFQELEQLVPTDD